MGAPLHLSPTRASRKQAALEFIKRHFAERGASPSFGEIAAALDTNTSRVSAIVHQLARDGQILFTPGKHRGIAMPDPAMQISRGDLLLALRQAGFIVDDDVLKAVPPAPPTVTNPSLPLIPELDHIPDVEIGGGQNDGDGEMR